MHMSSFYKRKLATTLFVLDWLHSADTLTTHNARPGIIFKSDYLRSTLGLTRVRRCLSEKCFGQMIARASESILGPS
ncbi:hypothetical protein F5Y08DRAFT_294795 [Xylaria arbuscula]|nr:hypothetical protein F5Y08DRAFT_294795 [Xylaria arbuscula]